MPLNKSVVNFLLLFSALCQPCSAQIKELPIPEFRDYPNPYQLMFEAPRQVQEGTHWPVFANQDRAPLLASNANGDPNPEHIVGFAAFRQKLRVVAKKGRFLKIYTNRLQGPAWVDMRYTLFSGSGIKEPTANVRLKAFFRVIVSEELALAPDRGENLLRFRRGPGPAGPEPSAQGRFQFYGEESAMAGSVMSYVYGVWFNNEDLNAYRDARNFKNADYFLVGDYQFITSADIQNPRGQVILRGWLPRQAMIIWDSRQAMERHPQGPHEAHMFANEEDLTAYFSCPPENRAAYLTANTDRILADDGTRRRIRGQNLRPIVLDQSVYHTAMDLVSIKVGTTGLANQTGDHLLADIQAGAHQLEVCFLVDATKSMDRCLDAAAAVADNLTRQLQDNPDVALTLHAAVFRDEADGYDAFEWSPDGSEKGRWLASRQARSAGADTSYTESVLNGIQATLNRWDFQHPYSMRVLVVLGDAGDLDQDLGPLIKRLNRDRILPVAVRFHHPPSAPQSRDAVERETSAFEAFKTQMDKLIEGVYGTELGPAGPLATKDFDTHNLNQGLNDLVTKTVSSLANMIGKMRDIRFGLSSFKENLCGQSFDPNGETYRACVASPNFDALLQFLKRHGGHKENGLIMAYLKGLTQNDAALLDYILERPHMALSPVVIPLRHDTQYYTRPVLLLGASELMILRDLYGDVLEQGHTCRADLFREALVYTVSLILGETGATQTDAIGRYQFERWLTRAVGSELSWIDNWYRLREEDKHKRLCDPRNTTDWRGFLQSVAKGQAFIDQLLNNQNPDPNRLYRDLQEGKYYWVYPEEICPPWESGT